MRLIKFFLVAAVLIFGGSAHAQSGCGGQVPAGKWCGNPSGAQGLPRWSFIDSATGPLFFGSGQHWVDVRSGANGCATADPTGAVSATVAINCQVTYMSATFGGGIVFISPGSYLISGGGIVVPAGVRLIGVGETSSVLFTSTDSTVVTFATTGTTCPSGNHDGGMGLIYVAGYTVSPTKPAVKIGDNCNVTIRDSKILYGSFGLQNDGVDSKIQNNFIWGYTAALSGGGANWYFRNKFDQPGADAATYGYHQTANISGLTTPENFFIQNDFSGNYTFSIKIDDTGNTSLTHFLQNVSSSPIVITNSRYVGVVDSEIGSTTFTVSNGNLGMVGSYGFASTTLTGGGSRACSANTNLTC